MTDALPTIDRFGNWQWLDADGLFHNDNGPAVLGRNGQRHREDGPAIEGADGSKEWWEHGTMVRSS